MIRSSLTMPVDRELYLRETDELQSPVPMAALRRHARGAIARRRFAEEHILSCKLRLVRQLSRHRGTAEVKLLQNEPGPLRQDLHQHQVLGTNICNLLSIEIHAYSVSCALEQFGPRIKRQDRWRVFFFSSISSSICRTD